MIVVDNLYVMYSGSSVIDNNIMINCNIVNVLFVFWLLVDCK